MQFLTYSGSNGKPLKLDDLSIPTGNVSGESDNFQLSGIYQKVNFGVSAVQPENCAKTSVVF